MVAAADLLGSRAIVGQVQLSVSGMQLATGDIRSGDLVIHEDHGVGRVVGLEPAPGDRCEELIALEYAGGNRRLVAVHDASRLWRYGSDGDAVTLDKLDGSSWEKRRGPIDEAVAESARELRLAEGAKPARSAGHRARPRQIRAIRRGLSFQRNR
jgi:transcription-repair coupling factor (superfamily II helicase)